MPFNVLIDVSVPLQEDMLVWPGSSGLQIRRIMHLESGDSANVTHMGCDVHVGTHVDAPLHFISGGPSVETMPLDLLIGLAIVAYLPDAVTITTVDLEALTLPDNTERLLFHTRNSELWESQAQNFHADYAALTADAARWIVMKGIRLVGIDYLSVQRYHDGPETYRVLLGAKVIIVEGLNLSKVSPGKYELICLPLKLVGAEGAPARAVLRPLS